jgi:general secretion pathway protein G
MVLEPRIRSRQQAPRRSRGFTLVEVLTVVALIGVLAAVTYPFYSNYRSKILVRQAVVDLIAMSTSIGNYWNDGHAFPASLADVGLSGKLDPWGRPYVYYNVAANGIGHARKDHALNPLNTDFDLYSLGPDGKTKPQITQRDSVDDIIRGSNGAFYGVAADF